MVKLRRHRYFVNKPVQFRYINLALAPLVIFSAAVYYLIYYSVFNQILIPEAVATILLPAMKKVNIAIIFAAPLVLFFVLRTTLVSSNRTIGPIPRLEKELDKAISGDYSVRMKVRDRDDLKAFIDKINALLDNLEKTSQKA